MTDYSYLIAALEELSDGVEYAITVLSNAAALLFGALERINWTGFYLVRGEKLILGPFQGKTACTVIETGKGVCGTAAAENRTVLVPDVHLFPGHIACDSASRSEIVVPIRVNGKLHGVLDIDSPETNRFSEADRVGLEKFVRILEGCLEKTPKH